MCIRDRDNVLVAAKFLQPHGTPGVQLLGRDAHLTAQTKLAAVGKAGGAVHIPVSYTHLQQGAAGFAGLLGAQSQPVSVYSISIAGQAAALSGE